MYENLRIIWAIAAKDIVDALKNKSIFSNIVGAILVIVVWRLLPSLYKPSHTDVVVYDAGFSQLASAIESDSRLRLLEANSIQELEASLADEAFGVAIPADYDQRVAAGEQPVLEGFVPWANRFKAAETGATFAQRFSELLGHPVLIHVEGNWAYPLPDSMGPTRTVALTLVFVLLYVSTAVVPLLMVEEKQTRTLEVLLVSPASTGQVVVGKALSGLFYCFIAAAVAFALNWTVVIHWALAILATLFGAVCIVGLGLLVGSFIDRQQQLNVMLIPVLALLAMPMFLNYVDPILPEQVGAVLHWFPTVALARLYRVSFAWEMDLSLILSNLAIGLAWVLPVYIALIWKVRRSDR